MNKDFGESLMTEIKTPDWVKNAVFYQIFPDRFARSNRVNHPAGIKFSDWNSNPTEKSFHGGGYCRTPVDSRIWL